MNTSHHVDNIKPQLVPNAGAYILFFALGFISAFATIGCRCAIAVPALEGPASQLKLRQLTADIQKHPEDPKVFYERGKFWYDHMIYGRARADLEQSLRVQPTPMAYFLMGKVNLTPPDNEKSLLLFARARELGAKDIETLANLGGIYNNMRLYDKAEDAYSAALKINPNDLNFRSWRAMNYLSASKFEKAVSEASIVLSKKPISSVQTHANETEATRRAMAPERELILEAAKTRGISLVKLKRYKEALPDLSAALSLAPDDGPLLKYRAQAYQVLGQKELANRDLKRQAEQKTFMYNNALFSTDMLK